MLSFKIHSAESKEEAKKDHGRRTREIEVYTNGSDIEGGIGAAAVLYWRERRIEVLWCYLGRSEKSIMYKAELMEILLGLELIRRAQCKKQYSTWITKQQSRQPR